MISPSSLRCDLGTAFAAYATRLRILSPTIVRSMSWEKLFSRFFFSSHSTAVFFFLYNNYIIIIDYDVFSYDINYSFNRCTNRAQMS